MVKDDTGSAAGTGDGEKVDECHHDLRVSLKKRRTETVLKCDILSYIGNSSPAVKPTSTSRVDVTHLRSMKVQMCDNTMQLLICQQQ